MTDAGIRRRSRARGADRFEVRFTDQHGNAQSELCDSREAARMRRKKRLAEVRAGTYVPPGSPQQTLARYAEHYFAGRSARTNDDDRTRFEKHIAPHLGDRHLGVLRPRDIATWIKALAALGKLSAKSIRNVHGVLHAMLEHARFEDLIASNPAKLPRGMLPRLGRKREPRFERGELERLIGDERIEHHRRVFYALCGLGGMRCGEASGRRWRDLDADAPSLAALTVATQYEDEPLKTSEDEHTAERIVPIHPTLHAILDDWRERGFAATYGRAPELDDWLCPDPLTGKPRTKNQAGKALYRDCDRIGLPRRGTHAFRRAFISLCRSDGARADVLERVTHNAKGQMIDCYTSFEWQPLCDAVACLRLALSGPVAGPVSADPCIQRVESWRRRESKLAPGPTSDDFSRVLRPPNGLGADVKTPEEGGDPARIWPCAQAERSAMPLAALRFGWDAMELTLARELEA